VGTHINEDDTVEGTVKRIVTFGAFIEIEDGVGGLVHISQIANRHIGTPDEVLEVGQVVKAKVLGVSEQEERISLSMKELEVQQEKSDYEQYEKDEDSTSFELGDIIGQQLEDYKNE